MKRRSQVTHKRIKGNYSRKMATGQFMYGGFTNHCNVPGKPPRRCHAKHSN